MVLQDLATLPESELMTGQDEPSAEDSNDTRAALTWWERLLAGIFGVLAGGSGGWSVFVSDNQAGSGALVLFGAAMILMAVQGTPLVKFDATGSWQLERRKHETRKREVVSTAKNEPDERVAQGLYEALSILEPNSTPKIYEARVINAIRSLKFSNVTKNSFKGESDAVVETPLGRTVVEVKFKREGVFGKVDLRRTSAQMSALGIKRAVIVTNAPLSDEVLQVNTQGSFGELALEVVRWVEDNDTDLLNRALLRGHE